VNEKEINMRQLWTRASRPEDHHRSRGRLKLWLVVGVAALAAVVTAGERPARVPWVTNSSSARRTWVHLPFAQRLGVRDQQQIVDSFAVSCEPTQAVSSGKSE